MVPTVFRCPPAAHWFTRFCAPQAVQPPTRLCVVPGVLPATATCPTGKAECPASEACPSPTRAKCPTHECPPTWPFCAQQPMAQPMVGAAVNAPSQMHGCGFRCMHCGGWNPAYPPPTFACW